MFVRREVPSDHALVRAVHAEAFGAARAGGEPMEARLVDALRDSGAWIPELSWVVEHDGDVVGHVVCTRGDVDGIPAAGLGPLGIAPALQRRGAGSALVHAVIGAADALGEPLIALLGAPEYYGRFGFVAAAQRSIAAPDPSWGEHFQVRTLTAFDPSITGTFTYATPFTTVI